MSFRGWKLVGADKIVGVDLNDAKEEWGRRFGMTHFVNPAKVSGDLVAHLVALTDGGADYTFRLYRQHPSHADSARSLPSWLGHQRYHWCRGIGQGNRHPPLSASYRPGLEGLSLRRCQGPHRCAPDCVDWYMDGKIAIDPMITHVLTLEEINRGFDLMHAGESIRSVVVY